jgi:hypothetical protein
MAVVLVRQEQFMATRHPRYRLTAVVAALAAGAGLALHATPSAAADPPISYDRVEVPMIFPVVGGASYTDTFGACRGTGCSRKHLGQDLMAPKMRPLVAVFTGTISYVKRETRVGDGNYFSLTGTTGWTVNYIHVNNDTPGTDDGKGTANWSLMPGLKVGSRVFAGQQIGWTGDSGNAESTAPHTHFELRKGAAWTGTVYNPYASLKAAPVLSKPKISGPHPDGALIFVPKRGAWVLENGVRRRVLFSNLAANGWTTKHLITVTVDELLSYPSAGWLPLPEGLVARAPDGSMWVIADGERIAVPAGSDLARLGTTEARVAAVDSAAINRTPLAADQTLPGVIRPGALLRDAGTSRRWYIDGGVRRSVANVGTMASWGWTTEELTIVPAGSLDDVPVGPSMKLRDGTVFTSPDGPWWVVSAGVRRRIPSTVVRNAYGWSLVPRIRATTWSTNLLPLGATLP